MPSEHVAAGGVEALASLRSEVWARIAEHARTWTHRPEVIVVYGSAARDDGDTTSDIDLLVIRPGGVAEDDPAWHQNLTDLVSCVTRWTGDPCEMLDRSADQLRAMATDGERLLGEIRHDGRVVVGALALEVRTSWPREAQSPSCSSPTATSAPRSTQAGSSSSPMSPR